MARIAAFSKCRAGIGRSRELEWRTTTRDNRTELNLRLQRPPVASHPLQATGCRPSARQSVPHSNRRLRRQRHLAVRENCRWHETRFARESAFPPQRCRPWEPYRTTTRSSTGPPPPSFRQSPPAGLSAIAWLRSHPISGAASPWPQKPAWGSSRQCGRLRGASCERSSVITAADVSSARTQSSVRSICKIGKRASRSTAPESLRRWRWAASSGMATYARTRVDDLAGARSKLTSEDPNRDTLIGALALLSESGLCDDCACIRPFVNHAHRDVRREARRTMALLECPAVTSLSAT